MTATVQLLTDTFHLHGNPAVTLQVGQRDSGSLVLVVTEHREYGPPLVMTAATLTDIDRVASRLLGVDFAASSAGAGSDIPDAIPSPRLPHLTDAHAVLLSRIKLLSLDGYVSDRELYEADAEARQQGGTTPRETWRGYRLLGDLEDAGLVIADHQVVVAADGSSVSDVLCFALTDAGRNAVSRPAPRGTRDDGDAALRIHTHLAAT